MKKNNLPDSWCVRNDDSDDFKKVIEYLNTNYDCYYKGDCCNTFYGISLLKSPENNYNSECFQKILTIGEFLELSKPIVEFVLPEYWYITVTNVFDNYPELFNWRGFWGSPGCIDSSGWWTPFPKEEYIEITYDQFKKYVLKQEIMEKKIIGYKFKKEFEQFDKPASLICKLKLGDENLLNLGSDGCAFWIDSECAERLTEAGVLDLWFEPVYGKISPIITINNYKGEFYPEYVKFGCAEISKEVFIELNKMSSYSNTNKEIMSVTIGKGVFSASQIKEIAEYYTNTKQ